MIRQKIPCPRCGQDWVAQVRLVHLQRTACLCPECDALWAQPQDISFETFVDYGEFMVRNGRAEPESVGEVEFLGPLVVGESSPPGEGKLGCPACNNGRISFVRMMKRGFHFFFVCDECDSSWSNIDAIGTSEVMSLSDRVRPLGFRGLRAECEEIPYPTPEGPGHA